MEEYNKDYTDYQLDRSWLRKQIRKIYLRNIKKYTLGASVDFGCGVGELLEALPGGSVGLEINKDTVRYCKEKGLSVFYYNGDDDAFSLKTVGEIEKGMFRTFIMSHVLEHMPEPEMVFNNILAACRRLQIERIISIVPCRKGFHFDKTHKVFIDNQFFEKYQGRDDYTITIKKYFPFNIACVGNYFTYNELFVVMDKKVQGD